LNAFGRVNAGGGHEVNRRERAAIELLQDTESEQARVLLLQEERRRFNAMRTVQRKTARFTRYSALASSILAFGFLWCVGAAIFWRAERTQQPWTYPESLYFCYVSLLTVGYGDYVPISNTGKPFFVVWSLVAVPTMTILVSNIADTFIASYKRGTIALAEWIVLPEGRDWRGVAARSRWLVFGRPRIGMKGAQEKPVTEAIQIGVDEEALEAIGDLTKSGLNDHDLAIRLALTVQKTANDLKAGWH
jgi:potassium channel subfamily K, other eukaryote